MKRVSIGMVIVAMLIALAALTFRFCLDHRDPESGRTTQMRVVATKNQSTVPSCVKVSAWKPNVTDGDSQPTRPLDVERLADAEMDHGDATFVDGSTASIPVTRPISPLRKKEGQSIQRFDALTDKWSKPQKTPATVEDVKAFVAAFQGLPPSRRLERLQRSLNLIPDENVILLAGVLLDKGTDEVSAKAIYDDIINRDELVKKPIIEEIYKDKTHPCWDDTRWIFEVTGESPKEI